MSSTTPVAVPTTIDHLDFEVSCHFTRSVEMREEPCPLPAAWWILSAGHCSRPDAEPRSGFICDPHMQKIMRGEMFMCRTCTEPYTLLPKVIRTERIR